LDQRTDARIEAFVAKVRAKYELTQAIFFGSRARGDFLVDSDCDTIVVSPDFEGVFFSRRSALTGDSHELTTDE